MRGSFTWFEVGEPLFSLSSGFGTRGVLSSFVCWGPGIPWGLQVPPDWAPTKGEAGGFAENPNYERGEKGGVHKKRVLCDHIVAMEWEEPKGVGMGGMRTKKVEGAGSPYMRVEKSQVGYGEMFCKVYVDVFYGGSLA